MQNVIIKFYILFFAGEPDISEQIIMALRLSSNVHGTSTGRQDSDVDPDHEIYRRSSHFCGHQEVCEDTNNSDFRYTPPGKLLYQCHSSGTHEGLSTIYDTGCAMLHNTSISSSQPSR